jgi:alkyl hydroperoxide reductase subunit AhpC
VAQLRRGKEKFDAAGLRAVLVSMGSPDLAEAFRRQFDLPFPIICDPGKSLYRTFGLKGSSMVQIFSPDLFLKGLKAVGRGHFPGLIHGDPFQLPGVFIVDTLGQIRFSYLSRDPSDYPSVETIVAAALSI